MAGIFRCKDCHMNFQSQQLLTKHKSKFCVGSTTDPDDLQLRRGLRSSSPPRFQSPDDRDDYRRNPNSDQQLRSLAENHGRQMEYLQLQNRDLEKQREDIRKRLEGLGRRTVVQPQDNSADLLRELREQEVRNQRALDDLRRQLQGMNTEPRINVIEVEKPVYQQPPPPPPPPEPKKPIVFPVYYGKSLVAEISAIRQAYLQNGGNDPDVLAQMAQMQAEAQAIEDQMNQKPEPKPKEKPKDNNAAFRMLEMENEKLIQELRLLQEQNALAQNRRRSDKEDELEREIRRLQKDHLEKMYGLQKDLDDMRMLMMMERNRPPPQTVVQQAAQPPVSLKPYVEVEPMAPYDQYGNRFDKRTTPSVSRAWIATQHSKTSERPLFPVYQEEFGEEASHNQHTTQNVATPDNVHQGFIPSTPALHYKPPADYQPPVLVQSAAGNQPMGPGRWPEPLTPGPSTSQLVGPRYLQSSQAHYTGGGRVGWGQDIG